MEFNVLKGRVSDIDAFAHIIFCNKDGVCLGDHSNLQELLQPFVDGGEFGTKFGGNLYAIAPASLSVKRLLFFNLGDKPTNDSYRKASASALKLLREKNVTHVSLSLSGLDPSARRAVVEGVVLGDYQFNNLRSETDQLPKSLEHFSVHVGPASEPEVVRWFKIAQGTLRARDLCQYPANIMDPTAMAQQAQRWGEQFGFKTEVLNKPQLEELNMGALLSVAQGSQRPPHLIVMDYQPASPSGKTFVFVGKAVTFDSGGLSLKPANAMAEMKGDMGGGAAVIGLMTVLRDSSCNHRVVGLVPAVENMPSGSATRPSDVVTSMSGITVEINNTDAEGRLILADALTYAARYQPDYVVDFATLTGACLVALGPKVFGVMGNDQKLVDEILTAGQEVDEIFWQLPLVDDYNEMLKSQVADIANVAGSRWGGTITAGLFLQKFAKDYKWAHCDIAATIFEKPDAYRPAGGTGTGVRMAMAMLDRMT
ncbi:MAG: leucyl aminopeptidase [Acidobacteria bacterium]|nr:leucyl aminopeptidase [Acidobacteriota bacterium]